MYVCSASSKRIKMKADMLMKHSTNIWDCLCKSECSGTNHYFLPVGEKAASHAQDCCCLAVARGYHRGGEGGNGLHPVTKDRSASLQRIDCEVVPG